MELKSTTREELILKTLCYISDKAYKYNIGFVDVRWLWLTLGIPESIHKAIIDTLVEAKSITIGYDRPYSFEITNPIGASIFDKLGKHEKLDDFNLSRLPSNIALKIPGSVSKFCFRIKILWWNKIKNNPWVITIICGLVVGLIAGWIVLILGTEYLVNKKIIH